jgi:hypothetical protein
MEDVSMPGLFSKIGSAFSGSGQDDKLVLRIEEFASGFIVQSDVPRTLGLRHEDVALLDTLLAERLYRAYSADQAKKAPSEKTVSHFATVRKECEDRLGLTPEALARLEQALEHVADDLTDVARLKGKIQSGFESVDGLTESIVSAKISARSTEVKAARRMALH